MANHLTTQRYYYTFGKQQLKNIAFMVVIAVIMFVYGSGLRNRDLGEFFMLLAGVYPLIILLAVLQNVKSLNHVDLESDGLYITNLRLFHRRIKWSEVASLSLITINGAENIGIMYNTARRRRGWTAHYLVKTFGYEGVVRQGYAADGQALAEAAAASYAKFTDRAAGKLAKAGPQPASMTPVQIKSSFSIADLWKRPNGLAWFGALLVCNILAGMTRQSPTLRTVFGMLGLVSLAFFSMSLSRFRRVAPEATQKKPKAQKPDDWSNLM